MDETRRERPEREGRDRPRPGLSGRALLIAGSGDPAPGLARAAEERGARVALAVPEPVAPRGVWCLAGDSLDDPAACDSLFEAVLERFSRLDAVIVTVPARPVGALDALSLKEWEENVTAPLARAFWLARSAVWEFLAGGGGGRLVFVTGTSSGSGEEPRGVLGGALYSLARSIAKEAGPRGVACNVVLAGEAGPGEGASPPAVVDAVLYLASEDASFVNGEALTVRTRSRAGGVPRAT